MIFVSVQPSSTTLFVVRFPLPTPSRATGFATQDHAQAQNLNAAQGNTQDMEANWANLFKKECQGCSDAQTPPRPAPRIQPPEAIVTSQPWI